MLNKIRIYITLHWAKLTFIGILVIGLILFGLFIIFEKQSFESRQSKIKSYDSSAFAIIKSFNKGLFGYDFEVRLWGPYLSVHPFEIYIPTSSLSIEERTFLSKLRIDDKLSYHYNRIDKVGSNDYKTGELKLKLAKKLKPQ